MESSVPTNDYADFLDLDAAFTDKASKQEGADPEPDQEERVESFLEDPDSDSGTTPSRPEDAPKNVDPLAELSVEDLLKHPVLGKKVQSWKDADAARQMTGVRQAAERETRQRLESEITRKHFEGMSDAELIEAVKDPETKARWMALQNEPPPPPQEVVDAAVAHYTNLLVRGTAAIAGADLSPEVKASLDPNLHITKTGDPDTIMQDWLDLIQSTVLTSKHQKELDRVKGSVTRAQALESELDQDRRGEPDPMLDSGRTVPPVPDLMTTTSDQLLDDAFERTARLGNRRVRTR